MLGKVTSPFKRKTPRHTLDIATHLCQLFTTFWEKTNNIWASVMCSTIYMLCFRKAGSSRISNVTNTVTIRIIRFTTISKITRINRSTRITRLARITMTTRFTRIIKFTRITKFLTAIWVKRITNLLGLVVGLYAFNQIGRHVNIVELDNAFPQTLFSILRII